MVKAQSPFASVARKIGNRRLEKVLAQLSANISTEVQNTKHLPKVSDVRNNFRLLKGEAQRFERALGRISLLDVPVSAIECLPDARKTTRDISALCDKALSNISVKRGAPKRPGRVTCALIIIEEGAFERGRLAEVKSRKRKG